MHTHSYTHGGINRARQQPARLKWLGFGALLKDTSTLSEVEPEIDPATFQVARQPALPPGLGLGLGFELELGKHVWDFE